MHKDIVYNPESIDVDALEYSLRLMTTPTGDLLFDDNNVDIVASMIKKSIIAYIDNPKMFEATESMCSRDCKGRGSIVDFTTKQRTYYCRLQQNCPNVDCDSKCPYGTDEERDYAYAVLELKNALQSSKEPKGE